MIKYLKLFLLYFFAFCVFKDIDSAATDLSEQQLTLPPEVSGNIFKYLSADGIALNTLIRYLEVDIDILKSIIFAYFKKNGQIYDEDSIDLIINRSFKTFSSLVNKEEFRRKIYRLLRRYLYENPITAYKKLLLNPYKLSIDKVKDLILKDLESVRIINNLPNFHNHQDQSLLSLEDKDKLSISLGEEIDLIKEILQEVNSIKNNPHSCFNTEDYKVLNYIFLYTSIITAVTITGVFLFIKFNYKVRLNCKIVNGFMTLPWMIVFMFVLIAKKIDGKEKQKSIAIENLNNFKTLLIDLNELACDASMKLKDI